MSIVRDKIYFIYNDNAKNYSAKNKENSFYNWEGDHSIIAMSEVHQDGSVYTFPLLHDKHTSVVTRPKVCRQIGKKVMAIYGESGRKSQFGKLKF